MSRSVFDDIEKRKAKFWQQCLECEAHHPEWPHEAWRDFFLLWSEENECGLMRWETLPFFGLGHRMGSYMKRRRYLESYYGAKLERVRGKKAAEKTTTQLRAEAMEQEAQNAYDKYFEEQEARGKMKEEK